MPKCLELVTPTLELVTPSEKCLSVWMVTPTRKGQYGTGCPNPQEPVGFFHFGLIPEENMFGVLRLEH